MGDLKINLLINFTVQGGNQFNMVTIILRQKKEISGVDMIKE